MEVVVETAVVIVQVLVEEDVDLGAQVVASVEL